MFTFPDGVVLRRHATVLGDHWRCAAPVVAKSEEGADVDRDHHPSQGVKRRRLLDGAQVDGVVEHERGAALSIDVVEHESSVFVSSLLAGGWPISASATLRTSHSPRSRPLTMSNKI